MDSLSTRSFRVTLLLVLLSLVLTTCNLPTGSTLLPTTTDTTEAPTTVSPPASATAEIVNSDTATPSPTVERSRVVLLTSADADPAETMALQTLLEELTAADGLSLEVRSTLTLAELTPDLRAVIGLPPDPDLSAWAATATDVQFLGIGIPGLTPAANLSVISVEEARPDQLGFLAGYIAAAVTPEYRVGMIGVSDTQVGVAIRQGFINGAIYYCGLCKQTYPPYYTYPLYVESSAASDPATWQAAADALIERAVQTVYVAPGAGDETLLTYLAQKGVNLIGNGAPPAAIQEQWVASVRFGITQSVRMLWPDMSNGKGGASLSPSAEISDVNPALFSPGRQRLVDEMLGDLLEGSIDTGVALEK